MKLTDWFPANAKPARAGWYQRDWNCPMTEEAPDYWDGNRWWLGDGLGNHKLRSDWLRPWRGLAEDPSLPPSEPTHV